MVRAHFVLETRWVRDESGGGHVGSMESGCAQGSTAFSGGCRERAGVEPHRQPEV